MSIVQEAIMRASEEVSAMTEEEVRQYLFSILADSYIEEFYKGEKRPVVRKPPTDLEWKGATSER